MDQPQRSEIVGFDQWSPNAYLHDYYAQIEPDERATIEFTVREFQKIPPGTSTALEVGIGPTLHRALALSPHVESIQACDFLSTNLQQVEDWVAQKPTAHSWGPFTDYILRCEGIAAPTREQVVQREALTRSRLGRTFVADVTQPLTGLVPAKYPVVTSCYCSDSITVDRAVWKASMQHTIALVAAGGFFLTAALRHCQAYRVGNHWFPCANVDEEQVRVTMLECGVTPESLILEVVEVPQHQEVGYSSIILASGFLSQAMGRCE